MNWYDNVALSILIFLSNSKRILCFAESALTNYILLLKHMYCTENIHLNIFDGLFWCNRYLYISLLFLEKLSRYSDIQIKKNTNADRPDKM